MSGMDTAPDDVLAPMDELARRTSQIVINAWTRGLRDGLEGAAQLMDAIVAEARVFADTTPECRTAVVAVCTNASARLRLSALELVAPEVPSK